MKSIAKLAEACSVYIKNTFSTQADNILFNIDGFHILKDHAIFDQRTASSWLVGPDRNLSWEAAKQWVSSHEGYTMPSIEQLRLLFNPAYTAGVGYFKNGRYWPAKLHPVFQAIGGGSWVWSSYSVGRSARAFNFYMGEPDDLPKANTTYAVRAFAVCENE